MTNEDYEFIRTLLRNRSAIDLGDSKQYLVEARLAPLVRQENLSSITELVQMLRFGSSNGIDHQIIEAMVTTESSFFRDLHPFDALRKTILPELAKRRAAERILNIWCAACSTGQEPYSLVLLVREYLKELAAWKINVLATDLSRTVLAKARDGRYSQLEVNRGLPASLLVKYFIQHGTTWELKPEVRQMVDFREFNLCEPWPILPRMDLVLMRNVMIYFDVDTKKTILGRLSRLLQPDGYLLLGSAETTLFLDESYRRAENQTGFYELVR